MALDSSILNHNGVEEELTKELEKYLPRRSQRYTAVNVLLITWEAGEKICAEEAATLSRVFEEDFNYCVWPYQIPRQDSQRLLGAYVGNFVGQFGGQDKLLLVYYGGHGGRVASASSICTWAADISGGPTLDWSNIQPLLFNADCDVVIFLDCCYAGQAGRPHYSQCIEFLAATDKDQMTPLGARTWPSFTKVLTKELVCILHEKTVVTVPELQRRMVHKSSGLVRQPFYISLSEGSAGKVQLKRSEGQTSKVNLKTLTSLGLNEEDLTSIYLRLSLRPLDSTNIEAMKRWMTKDSPSSIEHISIVKKVLDEVNTANVLATRTFDDDEGAGDHVMPFLSDPVRLELQHVFNSLKDILHNPSPMNLSDEEAINILRAIREKSREIVELIEDCLSSLDARSLESLETRDLGIVHDLKSRIAMRLKLLGQAVSSTICRVDFKDRPQEEQRFRVGKQGDEDVLVEYWYHDDLAEGKQGRILESAERISALLAEPKSTSFGMLNGRGFVYETLLQKPRIGFAYHFPESRTGLGHITLAQLIRQGGMIPLEVRVGISRFLCDAVLHLHSVGWFHKGIKTENVLIFAREKDGGDSKSKAQPCDLYHLTDPYLIGFDCSRPADAESWSTVDFVTKTNIYRHPERWGRPVRFERHHDLYALGIVLLEVGSWRVLPSMDSRGKDFESIKDPERLRDFLLTSAHAKLAHSAGSVYANATKVCWERRDWAIYEDWQVQRFVRDEVLKPLVAYSD